MVLVWVGGDLSGRGTCVRPEMPPRGIQPGCMWGVFLIVCTERSCKSRKGCGNLSVRRYGKTKPSNSEVGASARVSPPPSPGTVPLKADARPVSPHLCAPGSLEARDSTLTHSSRPGAVLSSKHPAPSPSAGGCLKTGLDYWLGCRPRLSFPADKGRDEGGALLGPRGAESKS